MPYDPDFAIRGLHCDVSRGLLMKIDAYNHIHFSSVHRWTTALLYTCTCKKQKTVCIPISKHMYTFLSGWDALCVPPTCTCTLSLESVSLSICVTVLRGHQQVSKSEVLEMYGGSHVPLRVTEPPFRHHDSKMVQFLDLFSIPEATLFADVMEVRGWDVKYCTWFSSPNGYRAMCMASLLLHVCVVCTCTCTLVYIYMYIHVYRYILFLPAIRLVCVCTK